MIVLQLFVKLSSLWRTHPSDEVHVRGLFDVVEGPLPVLGVAPGGLEVRLRHGVVHARVRALGREALAVRDQLLVLVLVLAVDRGVLVLLGLELGEAELENGGEGRDRVKIST